MAQIEQWLLKVPFISKQRDHRNEELESYRFWLENGADTSTQRGLCEETRLVMMAWEDGMATWNLQRFLVHELYHAFQRDIASEYCNDTVERMGRGEHVHAVVEGAADYFTFFTADEMYTDADRQNYGQIGYRSPLNNLFIDALGLILSLIHI